MRMDLVTEGELVYLNSTPRCEASFAYNKSNSAPLCVAQKQACRSFKIESPTFRIQGKSTVIWKGNAGKNLVRHSRNQRVQSRIFLATKSAKKEAAYRPARPGSVFLSKHLSKRGDCFVRWEQPVSGLCFLISGIAPCSAKEIFCLSSGFLSFGLKLARIFHNRNRFDPLAL